MDFEHVIFEAKLFPTFFYFEVNANVLCSMKEDSYSKTTKKQKKKDMCVKGFFNGCFPKTQNNKQAFLEDVSPPVQKASSVLNSLGSELENTAPVNH